NHSQNWDFFISGTDGQNTRQITYDQKFHGSPALCDHQRTIVYYDDTNGRAHLGKLDPKTGSTFPFPNTEGGMVASCEGEGESVFYWGQPEGGTSYIFKIPFAGGTPVRFSDRVAISPPFLSLDGRHVLFATPLTNGSVGGALF